ncbi:transcriptional attenuator, LytR family [Clostridium cavendishii DSM 21758]|uniref:Regulatory protein MsrR n=1 Tax=Clostridium cavendishii DSM 21758 TaxID=1121302 RepID=A0A1M6IAV2_9CLOT|nr:LCP family protein [Clostridium cavendishii]SHJ31599.1 transcriptional attenuator, LytR family [Clostridium cavendishii DSM 21758]
MVKKIKEKLLQNKKKSIISLIVIVLMVLLIVTLAMKPFKEDDFKGKKVEVTKEEKDLNKYNDNIEVEKDCKNVLLLGVDSREDDFSDSRTDSIIIATVDPNGNTVKLTSVMRDTMVEVPGKGYYKINSAYSLGGVELLKRTLKYNFNINIDTYMIIDFRGFQEAIDVLGGIEVEVKDYEVKEINKYIEEVNLDKSTFIAEPGIQKLNGQQALSYSRIRKVGNGDFERMDRQKRVVGLVLDKAKKMNVSEYPELMAKMYPFIRSDMQSAYILKMANTIYKMQGMELKNFRIPLDNTGIITFVDSQWVVIPKLKETTKELMKFMYPDKDLSDIRVPDNSFIINKAEEQKRNSLQENKKPEVKDDSFLIIPPEENKKPVENKEDKPKATDNTSGDKPSDNKQPNQNNNQNNKPNIGEEQKPVDNNQKQTDNIQNSNVDNANIKDK